MGDEYYEVIRYQCDPSRNVVHISTHGLWNEEGRNFRWFDDKLAGAYNANHWVSKTWQTRRILRKSCRLRWGHFHIVMEPGMRCQFAIVPKVRVFREKQLIFRADEFGSTCMGTPPPSFLEIDAVGQRITVGVSTQSPENGEALTKITFNFPRVK